MQICLCLGHVGAQQCGHGAFAGGHRLLHGLAAQLEQARGISDREAAGGGQRGVLAERVARHHDRLLAQREAALLLQDAQHSERVGHQRRLGVLGQDQFLGGPLEHQPGELLLQGLVHLLEYLAGGREGGGKIASHADGLTALAREDEGMNRHAVCSRMGWRGGLTIAHESVNGEKAAFGCGITT